jgi:hypothetical protein
LRRDSSASSEKPGRQLLKELMLALNVTAARRLAALGGKQAATS